MNTTKNLVLQAEYRFPSKKSTLKKNRKNKIIPGICYGITQKAFSIQFEEVQFSKIYHQTHQHIPFSLCIENKDFLVLTQALQIDPVTRVLVHADFLLLSEHPVKTSVPINLIGTSKSMLEGGILEQKLSYLKIKVMPNQIPANISLNIEHLQLMESIYVKDLKQNPNYKVMNKPSQLIVTISQSRKTRLVQAQEKKETKQNKTKK